MATDTPAQPSPAAKPKAKPAAARKRAAAPKATAAPKTTPAAPMPDLNRAVFLSILDAQERAANSFADYQTRAAELSRIPGARTLATAQADLLRRVTVTYVTAARDRLK